MSDTHYTTANTQEDKHQVKSNLVLFYTTEQHTVICNWPIVLCDWLCLYVWPLGCMFL